MSIAVDARKRRPCDAIDTFVLSAKTILFDMFSDMLLRLHDAYMRVIIRMNRDFFQDTLPLR